MEVINNQFYEDIILLLNKARNSVQKTINSTMVNTYYEIGRRIVEEEQGGEKRAKYGKEVIIKLSKILTEKFGKGFSKTNLEQMRKFYRIYSIDRNAQTVSEDFILAWSHYVFLMRLEDKRERRFYEIEAFENNWSTRELKRQFDTGLYQRLMLNRGKVEVQKLASNGQVVDTAKDIIKDPYVFEFLGLEENTIYTESDLENRIIDKLEHFLMELGKGFLFAGRQVRISFDENHFYVDLVFYNRLLKCFVLMDLKIGQLKHQDIGQMQMYVNYYDRCIKMPDENKTIGIILCRDKNDTMVEMTLPEDNTQIFASKYHTVLPSKEELKEIIK